MGETRGSHHFQVDITRLVKQLPAMCTPLHLAGKPFKSEPNSTSPASSFANISSMAAKSEISSSDAAFLLDALRHVASPVVVS